jgi:hypothetical protein
MLSPISPFLGDHLRGCFDIALNIVNEAVSGRAIPPEDLDAAIVTEGVDHWVRYLEPIVYVLTTGRSRQDEPTTDWSETTAPENENSPPKPVVVEPQAPNTTLPSAAVAVTKTAQAIVMKRAHPEWTDKQVAEAVGCDPSTLSGSPDSLPDFTLTELKSYLSEVVGIDWGEVPFDVQKTLRRPLLAWLFRDVVPPAGWQPQNEYELYERSWERLRQRGVRPLDLDAVRQLAGSMLLTGATYPWSPTHLKASGLGQDALDCLVSAGWVRETTGDSYEIWHDRLLNWTVAEAVVQHLRDHPGEADACCESVAELLREPRAKCGRWLAYVPMDILWLLSDPQNPKPELFRRVASRCEAILGWRSSEILLGELLPTLGERAVPFLLERLRAAAETGPSYVMNNVIDGLVASGARDLSDRGVALVGDTSPKVRRAGVRLLTRCPSPVALNRLWVIHTEGVQNPAAYLWEHEGSWSLYDDTFDALKVAARQEPRWLERVVREADSGREPVHDLAYLVAQVGDPALWQRCKPVLMTKVDDKHQRSLATCVQVFRDAAEMEWLLPRVGTREDALGPVALRALAAIDPERALASLDVLPEWELRMTRDWCFGELVRRLPDQVMRHFATRLSGHPDPLEYAEVLQGREDLIDPKSLDCLLDRLSESLAATLRSESPAEIPASSRAMIGFVNAVCRPVLLDRLRLRRGTLLETHFTDWLLALGPQSGVCREYDKHEGLNALAKIGGDGFCRVLNDWLDRGDWYARMCALPLAQRRVTPRTVEILTQLSQGDEDGEESRRGMVSGYAAAALVTHRSWEPVLRYYLRVGLGTGPPVGHERLLWAHRSATRRRARRLVARPAGPPCVALLEPSRASGPRRVARSVRSPTRGELDSRRPAPRRVLGTRRLPGTRHGTSR